MAPASKHTKAGSWKLGFFRPSSSSFLPSLSRLSVLSARQTELVALARGRWTGLPSSHPLSGVYATAEGGNGKGGAPSSATQEKEQMERVEGGSEVRPSGAEKYVRLRREETQNVMHSLTGNTFGLHGWWWSPLLLCRFAHRVCAGRRGMKNSCSVGRSDLLDREGRISAR